MFPTDQTSAASTLPTPAAAGTTGFFTNGNPGTGVPATIVDCDFLNMIMEELLNVVAAGGITPSKTTYTQVRDAIKRINQNTVVLADTGAANAYSATNAVPLVAGTWVDGVVQAVKIAHANTTASTYAPDGLPAIPIYGLGLQPLQSSELAVGGTAILMHATIAGVNSGNPICVLMECAGGAQQIAPATASQHAVQLGQVTSASSPLQLTTQTATAANQSVPLGQVAALMRDYIAGLTLSNDGTNPNTQIDFAPGVAVDSTNAFVMQLSATLVKTLQASGSWTAGTQNNGLFSGAKAVSTWYHCFLIRNGTTGAVDAGFDTSVTAANIPSGWTAYRRVGSILTDASGNIRTFIQTNDEFLWSTPTLDINTTGVASGTILYAITIPTGVVVSAIVQGNVANSSGSSSFSFNRPGNSDVTGGTVATAVSQTASVYVGIGRIYITSNTSQQIQANSTTSGSAYRLSAYGWRDSRGTNN